MDHQGDAGGFGFGRSLERGVLVFRWVTLAWMTVLAVTGGDEFRRPVLAWASLAVAAGWTLWLTLGLRQWTARALAVDLAVCSYLMLISAVVVFEGDIEASRPFFAAGYPFSAALSWGAARGPWAGLAGGVVLGALYVMTRPLNGMAVDSFFSRGGQNLATNFINYVVAGAAVGLVSRLLLRAGESIQRANDQLVREREQTARLKERESLARQIHDSVLQALALVHKRGRELAARPDIPAQEVARLAEVAGRQESELRNLLMREPEASPSGTRSLRGALESLAPQINGIAVTVSAVGPIWIARACVDELAAATRQALENAAKHSRAQRVALFAERDGGWITISIRDDGVGFTYDEESLRRDGKAGMLKSMKGRVEELGGSMTVTTAPGAGTEVEFRVPEP